MPKENKTLFDIADSARLITEFLQGIERSAFDNDLKTQSAVLYQLAVIGEAVKQLPTEWREQHSSIPWRQIGRMRDHLIHHYFDVDLDTIWETATRDVPILLNYISPYVSVLLQESD